MNKSPGIPCRRWTVTPLLSVLVLALAASGPARASRIRPLNLEELTQRADRVFSGRCVNIHVERDPVLKQEVTVAVFAPRRSVKGWTGGSVTIRMLGDRDADSSGPRHGVVDAPLFHQGEEVVLFLYGENRHGLTSPVGFAQGKFVLAPDGKGRAAAINGYANQHLFSGLSAQAEQRLGAALALRRGRPDLTEEDLLDMVQALVGAGARP